MSNAVGMNSLFKRSYGKLEIRIMRIQTGRIHRARMNKQTYTQLTGMKKECLEDRIN